jgi:2-dehydro-3-deoxyphosphogluconate aldolase / (4S)-4-hydroxy-2-oxoglutarate aldolase
MSDLVKVFEDRKIIAVIRASDHGDAESIAKAVIDGGINIIEVIPNVTQSTKLVETLSKIKDVVVGFGSASDGEQAYRAITSGAQYVSTLYLDKNMIAVCKNNDVLVIPGASTLTEAVEAHNCGADLIRVFPVHFLGEAAYIKALRRSAPFLKLIPSGGIHLDSFVDYVKSGATACVLGLGLYDSATIRSHQWSEITARAKQFTQKLDSLKITR